MVQIHNGPKSLLGGQLFGDFCVPFWILNAVHFQDYKDNICMFLFNNKNAIVSSKYYGRQQNSGNQGCWLNFLSYDIS